MIPWLKEYYSKLKTYFPDIPTDNVKDKFIPRWKVTLLKEEVNGTLNGNVIEKDIYFSQRGKESFCEPLLLEVSENVRTTEEKHFQASNITYSKLTKLIEIVSFVN